MKINKYINKNTVCSCKNIPLKVALRILGRKFSKNTKKSSIYSQSILIFIHKTPTVEIRQQEKLENYYGPGLFLHEQLAHLHTGNTQESFKHSSNEDIMEIISCLLWNLSVLSHLIYPQCCF